MKLYTWKHYGRYLMVLAESEESARECLVETYGYYYVPEGQPYSVQEGYGVMELPCPEE